MRELSLKQEKFCREYVACCNATKAAKRAGYSAATCNEQGARLLANVSIKERIKSLGQNIMEALDLTAVRIAYEYKNIGFASVIDTHENWGTLKDFNSLDDEVKSSIAEIHVEKKTDKDGNTTEHKNIKMHDKLKALDRLAKMCGVAGSEKREIAGKNGGAIEVEYDYSRLSDDELDTYYQLSKKTQVK